MHDMMHGKGKMVTREYGTYEGDWIKDKQYGEGT